MTKASIRETNNHRRWWLGAAVLLGLAVLGGTALLWRGSQPPPPDVEASVQRALAQADVRQRIRALETVLARAPRHQKARLALADAYIRLGLWSQARRTLLKGRDAAALTSQEALRYVEALLGEERFAEALSVIGKRPEQRYSGPLMVLAGRALLGIGNPAAAHARFEQAGKLVGKTPDVRIGLARTALAANDYETVEEQLSSALKSAPSLAQAWELKAELALKRHDPAGAEAAFQKALDNTEMADPSVHFGLARAKIALQDYAGARTHLLRLQEQYPDHPLLHFLQGLAAFQQDDWLEAELHLLEALRGWPEHRPSQLLMGRTQFAMGNLQQAERFLSKYLEAEPDSLIGRQLLASVRLVQGKPEQAVTALKYAVGGGGEDPKLLALMGLAQLERGAYEEAARYLSQAADLASISAPRPERLSGLVAVADLSVTAAPPPETREAQAAADSPRGAEEVIRLLGEGQPARALERARQLLEQAQLDPKLHNLVGVAYLALPDLVSARQAFEQALVLDPTLTAAGINLAEVALREGDMEGAFRLYQQVLAIHPHHPDALMAIAKLTPDETQSLALIERARRHNPTALLPRTVLSQHYLRRGNALKAFTVAHEAAEIAPSDPQVLLTLARAQNAVGEYDRSAETYARIAALKPDSADLRALLAKARLQAGNPEVAKTLYLEALELAGGEHAQALNALGRIALAEGELEQARTYAEKLKRSYPAAPAGDVLMGELAEAQGDLAAAAGAFESAYEKSQNAALATKLFHVRWRRGEKTAATQVLEQWLALEPDDTRTRFFLAAAYQKMGEVDQSIAHYEKLLSVQSDHVHALNNLAWLYLGRDDARSLEMARQAYALASRSPEIKDTLGWVMVQSGDHDAGLALIRQAVEATPENASFRYHLAVALAKTQRRVEAQDTLGPLLDSKQEFPERDAAKSLMQSLKSRNDR